MMIVGFVDKEWLNVKQDNTQILCSSEHFLNDEALLTCLPTHSLWQSVYV